jgi:L-seryl-tRNA(Ser) seleniumtransferase
MCMENKLRSLPGVEKLLEYPGIKVLMKDFPHNLIVDIIRENLGFYRNAIAQGQQPPSPDDIVRNVSNQLRALSQPRLKPLINATGVVLHTNLGRAPLSQEAVNAMIRVSGAYSNLEFDLEKGERGSRHGYIESLLCRITGAEAGLVVNNNASAVLLGLTALAKRKEVIISRGQAVEIGGGFRIPEVMRQSGAKLIEVGTTNRTYIDDYEKAITSSTIALMRVHTSNFKVVGFSQSVDLEEIISLAKKSNVMVFDDLGSGCLLDTALFGLDHEPTVQESVSQGVDLALFSGDKLLGGPQAGIIVGKKIYLDKLKKHPLMRAMRLDKTRLAALEATLIHYLKGEALVKIPVWQMISMSLKELDRRAQSWAGCLGNSAQVIKGESVIGGGSMPGASVPTHLVAVNFAPKSTLAQKAVYWLRTQDPPVVGRISDDILLLDPRTVLPEEDPIMIKTLQKAFKFLDL